MIFHPTKMTKMARNGQETQGRHKCLEPCRFSGLVSGQRDHGSRKGMEGGGNL